MSYWYSTKLTYAEADVDAGESVDVNVDVDVDLDEGIGVIETFAAVTTFKF